MANGDIQVPVKLSNGASLLIKDVAPLPPGSIDADGTLQPDRFGHDDLASLDAVKDVIEGIATELKATLERVTPHSATVEFGLEISAETGALTAMLVKGGGAAHLTISLEWEHASSGA